MSKVINCDSLCDGDKRHIVENHPLLPQCSAGVGSFRWLVIGKTGTGKTNLVVSTIIQGGLKFDRLWLVSTSLDQPKYVLLTQYFNTIEKNYLEETGEPIEILTLISKTEDIPNLEELDPSLCHLFIFDDMLLEADQSQMTNYFVRGRHRNVCCIYLSQSYFDTPKLLRKQFDYVSIFSVTSNKELQQISSTLSTMTEYKVFKKMFMKATDDNRSFLLVDLRTDLKILRLRKNWDQIWADDIQDFEPIDLPEE